MKKVTKEQYKSESVVLAETIGCAGAKLTEIARFLNSSPDFSPATLSQVEDTLERMKAVVGALKQVSVLTRNRGLTSLEEEKERALAHVEEKRRQLLEGTLRVNRRESDMAAE